MQGKAANAAKEEAYTLYVTEFCKCSQRRKQNGKAILRLHNVLDGLRKTIKGDCVKTQSPLIVFLF